MCRFSVRISARTLAIPNEGFRGFTPFLRVNAALASSLGHDHILPNHQPSYHSTLQSLDTDSVTQWTMKQDALGRTNRLLSFDTTRTAQKTEQLGCIHKHRQKVDFTGPFYFLFKIRKLGNSIGFWLWCITHRINGFSDFGLRPDSK
jgi:hypothetical protein